MLESKVSILDTPAQINFFRLCALRGALSLEMKGMRGKRSAYATIKREFGFKGNRERVYTQLCEHIEKEKSRA